MSQEYITVRKVSKMTAEEVAAFRAKDPAKAAEIDAKMAKIKADLVAEFGQAIADSLMPNH